MSRIKKVLNNQMPVSTHLKAPVLCYKALSMLLFFLLAGTNKFKIIIYFNCLQVIFMRIPLANAHIREAVMITDNAILSYE